MSNIERCAAAMCDAPGGPCGLCVEKAERALDAYESLLRDALTFYADERTWGGIHYGTNRESIPGSGPGHLTFSYTSPAAFDLGERARSVLTFEIAVGQSRGSDAPKET